MTNKTYQLETLTCPGCVMKIEAVLGKIKGVSDVKVLFNASKVKVSFEESLTNEDAIRKTIEGLGYEVLGEK